MQLKQDIKLTQGLTMTPQLQQAIRLLQMSRLELTETLQKELLENPVLEDSLEGRDAREGPEMGTLEAQIAEDDRRVVDEGQNQKDVIDWERYLENHSLQAPLGGSRSGGREDEFPGHESVANDARGLVEHLCWQLQMGDYAEDELRFASLVLGNLDDAGYLRLDGVPESEIVPTLAKEAGLDPEDAEEVLALLQRLDPVGVASRSLRECLLVQAQVYGFDKLVIQTISDHLSHLERRNYSAIAKALEIELDEVYDIARTIADFEPRPGRGFLTEEPRYITPDVYVHRVGDEYIVTANDDGMPRLKISGFYRAAMADNPNAREYIQDKLRTAQWLIRSIEQRRKTITRVTECIVEKQREFFDHGIEHLKPMILRDIAEAVDMHESTISRVTSNKYVHTPRGIFELKFFFNSAIKRGSQEDIASESVKQAIKRIVDDEDPKRPYSDQAIVELLSQRDIHIARRTVAKYRDMLGILSSSKRKKYF